MIKLGRLEMAVDLVVPFLAVLSSELLSILHKLLAIFKEFFGEFSAQWMFWFRIVHQRHKSLNNFKNVSIRLVKTLN